MNSDATAATDEVYRRSRAAQAVATADILAQPAEASELAEAVAANAWNRTEALAAASPARPQYACSKGCRWCCHQPILVAAPEALALAGALRESFGPMGTQRLGVALAQRAERVGKPDWNRDWLAARLPCAFLTADGGCAAHSFRPVVCRGFHSLSRPACEAKYADQTAPSPPIDRASHLGSNGVLHGVLDATHASGRDGNMYELHGAVLNAIVDRAAALRWADGKDPFPGLWRIPVVTPAG